MSRRYLIPTNLFYRENDPLPPDFPNPNTGDVYYNTVSKRLRVYDDEVGAWVDASPAKEDIKDIAAASTDFADFQARIAAW